MTNDEREMTNEERQTTPLKIPICVFAGNEDLSLPAYQSAHAAAMDLRAAIAASMTIEPGAIALVGCGFAMALPEGYEGQVRPRSGLASKSGVTVVNTPGTIDADYRGEVKVALINLGTAPFVVERGARIAQLVVAPVIRVAWERVPALEETSRGAGGFGHTGT
jgi:dUTP pyrophosphatase